jgi:hypothetical protein
LTVLYLIDKFSLNPEAKKIPLVIPSTSEMIIIVSSSGLGVATAVAVGSVIRNVAMLLAAKYKTGIWTHFGIVSFSNLIRAIRTP